jgi:hypothetical protein
MYIHIRQKIKNCYLSACSCNVNIRAYNLNAVSMVVALVAWKLQTAYCHVVGVAKGFAHHVLEETSVAK